MEAPQLRDCNAVNTYQKYDLAPQFNNPTNDVANW